MERGTVRVKCLSQEPRQIFNNSVFAVNSKTVMANLILYIF